MIGLGEEVSDPADEEVAVGETLMEGMVAEVAVEDGSEVQLPQDAQQQRHIVDPFVLQDKRLWFHPRVLAFPPFLG